MPRSGEKCAELLGNQVKEESVEEIVYTQNPHQNGWHCFIFVMNSVLSRW